MPHNEKAGRTARTSDLAVVAALLAPWTSQCLPGAVALGAEKPASKPAGGTSVTTSSEGSPFVAKWNALGPGCPAVEGGAEGPKPDTPFVHRGPTKEEPRTHVFRFTLGKQRVASPRPTGEESRELAFGAECSIRMVLEPPQGTRIANAVARSTYRLSKGPEAEVWILSDLQLGNKTIARRRVDFPSGTAVAFRSEELALVPGRTAEESMPGTGCGQSKILGLDTIFAAKRKSTRDMLEVSLAEGALVQIVVDLAPC